MIKTSPIFTSSYDKCDIVLCDSCKNEASDALFSAFIDENPYNIRGLAITKNKVFFHYTNSKVFGFSKKIINLKLKKNNIDLYKEFIEFCKKTRKKPLFLLISGFIDGDIVKFLDKNKCDFVGIGGVGFDDDALEVFRKRKDLDLFKTIDIKTIGIERFINLIRLKYSKANYEIFIDYNIDVIQSCFIPDADNTFSFGLSNYEAMTLVSELVKVFDYTILEIGSFDSLSKRSSLTIKEISFEVKHIIDATLRK